jgi:hypothetical protein
LDTFGINVKRLMLTPFVVILLVGCIPIPAEPLTKEYVFEARNLQNKESAHLITKEESAHLITREESAHLIGQEDKDIVVLTNSRFRMLVFYDDLWLEMRLIVPAGEELFVKESFVELFDTATQQALYKLDVKWFHEDAQLDDDTGRLIGLMSSPPATKYKSLNLIVLGDLTEVNEIVLKFPVFRTKENETIKFDDVTFKIYLVFKKYKGRYQFVPIFIWT